MAIMVKDDALNPLHPAGMQPQLLFGVLVVYSVMSARGFPLVITSMNDGVHRARSARTGHSLHYDGAAFDFRLPSRCGGKDDSDIHMLEALKLALGGAHSDYDVVLEGDHFHVEYDPKPREA